MPLFISSVWLKGVHMSYWLRLGPARKSLLFLKAFRLVDTRGSQVAKCPMEQAYLEQDVINEENITCLNGWSRKFGTILVPNSQTFSTRRVRGLQDIIIFRVTICRKARNRTFLLREIVLKNS